MSENFKNSADSSSLNGAIQTLKSTLLERKIGLKSAESFTGGRIASAITAEAGASEFFAEGLVCYSLAAKMQRLGVKQEVLDNFGAVSLSCIHAMLSGLICGKGCDCGTNTSGVLAIATTGNAGPTTQNGDSGVCFVGAAYQSNRNPKPIMLVKRFVFDGTRSENIESGALQTVKCAIELLAQNQ